MSRIGSSSGVRVAAQPLSNVYTVLLLLGALALVVTAVMLGVTMNHRYKCVLGVTDEGSQAKKEPEVQKARQNSVWNDLGQIDKALKEYPEGVVAPAIEADTTAPAAGDATTPPAPEAPTPPAPEAPTPPAPEAPTPPAPEAPTPPAPEAPTPPAPEAPPPPAPEAPPPPAPEVPTPPAGDAPTPPAGDATPPAPEGGATPPAPEPAGDPAAN